MSRKFPKTEKCSVRHIYKEAHAIHEINIPTSTTKYNLEKNSKIDTRNYWISYAVDMPFSAILNWSMNHESIYGWKNEGIKAVGSSNYAKLTPDCIQYVSDSQRFIQRYFMTFLITCRKIWQHIKISLLNLNKK